MATPEYPLAQPAMPSRRATWFYKNRKWFIPVLVLSGLALFAGFALGVVSLVHSSFVNSYPYQFALQRANASQVLKQRIGSPLKTDGVTIGHINFNGSGGDAALDIPISGPNGRGTIVVVAKKTADNWSFETLEVDVAGQDEPIPLRDVAPLLRRVVVTHLGTFDGVALKKINDRLELLDNRPRSETPYDQGQVDHMKRAIVEFWSQEGTSVGVRTTLTQVPLAPRYSVLEFDVYKQ
jgi:Cytochrome oxidase complex assembly protein 1